MGDGDAIRGGEAGKRRLDVVAAVAWRATRTVLSRIVQAFGRSAEPVAAS
jgi:hypothetical protein